MIDINPYVYAPGEFPVEAKREGRIAALVHRFLGALAQDQVTPPQPIPPSETDQAA